MAKRILIGIAGGLSYTLFTWLVAFLGIIQWVGKNKLKEATMSDVAAPFSLIAICVFVTLYLFHKWQPSERKNKTFWNLFIIGFSFSLGATGILYLLLYLDGISKIYALVSTFFIACLFIATLTCSFYLFLKPKNANPKQEKLDEVFSNL